MVSHKNMAVVLICLVMGASCQPSGPYHQYEEAASSTPSHKQGFSLVSVLGPLATTYLVPLFSNLANGLTNAVTATFANRRLAIIPLESFPLRSNEVDYSFSDSDCDSDCDGPHVDLDQDHETRSDSDGPHVDQDQDHETISDSNGPHVDLDQDHETRSDSDGPHVDQDQDHETR